MVRYDAASEILKSMGDGVQGTIFGNNVILAPYVHSGLMWNERMGFPKEEVLSLSDLYALYNSPKGFVDQQQGIESIYQGKVCMVVALGEKCGEYGLQVGDWVWTLSENTRMVSLSPRGAQKSRVLDFLGVKYAEGWPCKICYETDLYGKLPDPFRMV